MVNYCTKAVAKEGACTEYATHGGYVTNYTGISVKCNVYFSFQFWNDVMMQKVNKISVFKSEAHCQYLGKSMKTEHQQPAYNMQIQLEDEISTVSVQRN